MRKKWFAVLLAAAIAASCLPAGSSNARAEDAESVLADGGEETDSIFSDTEEIIEGATEETTAVEEVIMEAPEASEDETEAGAQTQEELISDGESAAVGALSDDTEDEVIEEDISRDCGDSLTWEVTGTDLDGYTLIISGSGAMYDFTDLEAPWCDYANSIESVSFVGEITSIGARAFNSCKYITDITIPDSVTSIGEKAFMSCESLTGINIPGSVKSIGGYAFSGCSSLTDVRLHSGLTMIKENTFEGCSSLRNISIPGSVKSIGEYAFSNCSDLETITVSGNVTSIGESAFSKCYSLTGVSLPRSLSSIGTKVFDDCNLLTDIYYLGSEEQWKALVGNTAMGISSNTAIHYSSSESESEPEPEEVIILNPILQVNVSGTLPLKTKQKFKNLKVTMAEGDSVISWESSNTKIVKVSGNADGTCTITAQKKTGNATITVTLDSGLTKEIKIKVQKSRVTTKKIIISGVSSKLTMKKGESVSLSVTLSPLSSTDKITYKSSNKKVATVSSKGVIRAKKKGKATITVKAGKKTKKIRVTVK